MAIGTQVKVGWDAQPVKAGLSKMEGQFAAVSKRLGAKLGSALKVGALAVGAGFLAGMKDLTAYTANLDDMANQTGLNVRQILTLEEALRLAGAEMEDTSKMLSTLGRNLYEAGQEAGPARDALHKLGLRAGDIRGMKLDQAFELIGKRIADTTWEMGELETVTTALFGSKGGTKMIRFFRDYSANMQKAEQNTRGFADALSGNVEDLARMDDELGRFPMLMRRLTLGVYQELTKAFGRKDLTVAIDEMFQDLRKKVDSAGGWWNFITDKFAELGEKAGDAFRKALFKGIDPNGWLGKQLGLDKEAAAQAFRKGGGDGRSYNGPIPSGGRGGFLGSPGALRGEPGSIIPVLLDKLMRAFQIRDSLIPRLGPSSTMPRLPAPNGGGSILDLKGEISMLNQQMRTLIADQRSGNTSLRKIENLELGWA